MFDPKESVAEIFEEIQQRYADAIIADFLSVFDAAGCRHGAHISRSRGASGRSKSAPERAEYARAIQHLRRRQAIAARILAGERPRFGRPGRPPTLWFTVAESLGIDIGVRPAKLTPAQRANSHDRQKIRARLLAGERPQRHWKRWHEEAKALGIDLCET